MATKTSRYLMLSPRHYVDEFGVSKRLAYSSSRARMIVLDESTVEHLEAGAYDAISDEDFEVLMAAGGLVSDDIDELEAVVDRYTANAAKVAIRSFWWPTCVPTVSRWIAPAVPTDHHDPDLGRRATRGP